MAAGKKQEPVRITAVVTPDDKERIRYWAARRGVSENEYVRMALDFYIRRENKDYDLPSLEAARMNQMLDAIAALSYNVANLEHITTSGFDSLLRLTRGENYLDEGLE